MIIFISGEKIKKKKNEERKEKWVPFGGLCQDMALSKHTTCNRFSARSLLGKRASERVKGHVRVGTSERPADRERTREKELEEER